MSYEQFILTVNSSSIVILTLLTFILLIATRFRGKNSYAAAIIIIPTIPVYLYNMSRMLEWHGLSLALFPLAFSVNTTLMPLLWLFAKRNLDASFRFKHIHTLHFLPMIAFLALCLSVGTTEWQKNIVYEMSGDDAMFGDINSAIVLLQVIGYFTSIFVFIHRQKKRIKNSESDAEWIQAEWIVTFMRLFAVLFTVVMTCYMIWPRTDAWLIQILNVIAMSYLVYNSIAHPVLPALSKTEQDVADFQEPALSESVPIDVDQMREICEKATEYLKTTKAYLRPDINLALFAKEVGIPQRTLSKSINGYLHRNFFEFINEMRVEEAKHQLLHLDALGYNVDSVYTECGFRSRSTFFLVFKKTTGKTPATWLAETQKV